MECKQIACIYFWYVYRITDNSWEQTDVQYSMVQRVYFFPSFVFVSFLNVIVTCHRFSSSSFFLSLFIFLFFYFFLTIRSRRKSPNSRRYRRSPALFDNPVNRHAAILKILQYAGCNIKNIAVCRFNIAACFRKFNVVN